MGEDKLITKTKYIYGLKDPKYLWLSCNAKDQMPELDIGTKFRMEQGILVGQLAKQLFPDGIEIKSNSFKDGLDKSKEQLKLRKPLFEVGFLFGQCYSRADVLVPVEENEWDIVEVKSGTSVKEENIQDVSFQKYCYENNGIKIRNCYLMHLNEDYVRKGEIVLNDLFIKEDITEKVSEIISEVPIKVEEMIKLINGKCPETTAGNYMDDPYGCHKNDKFWKEHPECNILELYWIKKQAKELFNSGVLQLKDISEETKLGAKQKIQVECDKSKTSFVNKKGIKIFLDKLEYPLHYMDFETYSTAIPMYDGLSPYQPIPFQFSLHIIEKDGKTEHISFIFEGKGDPRKQFYEKLKESLEEKGSIIVYNQTFELSRLKELVSFMPEYSKWVESINSRVLDLLRPFRDFDYYHPSQHGSASIKKVLPALTGKGYEGMEINNGDMASLEYFKIVENKVSQEQKDKIIENLYKYCLLDTHAMVQIIEKLTDLK